jgi:hypothetical protein
MRYSWIHEHRDSYPVSVVYRVPQVSTSGYYRSLKADPGPRALRSARIREAVAAVFESSNGIYGSIKITRAGSRSRTGIGVPQYRRRCDARNGAERQGFHEVLAVHHPSKKPSPNFPTPGLHRNRSESEVGCGHHPPADSVQVGVYLA